MAFIPHIRICCIVDSPELFTYFGQDMSLAASYTVCRTAIWVLQEWIFTLQTCWTAQSSVGFTIIRSRMVELCTILVIYVMKFAAIGFLAAAF